MNADVQTADVNVFTSLSWKLFHCLLDWEQVSIYCRAIGFGTVRGSCYFSQFKQPVNSQEERSSSRLCAAAGTAPALVAQ